jgi:arylsulfatase
MTPFRSEKNTNWEGAWRVPAFVRWPGHIEPGSVTNGIFHHMDWMPTFMAALGEPDIAGKLKEGYEADGRTFKVHLDGYNQLDLLKGDGPGNRTEIHYISDDGDYSAFRYNRWKIYFLTQSAVGIDVWDAPYVAHRFPPIVDLRADPFERALGRADRAGAETASFNYDNWHFRRSYLLVPAQVFVGQFLASFEEFPPRSAPASFAVGDALKSLETAGSGAH